jgi:ribose 5-phosphate isomerase RpiB
MAASGPIDCEYSDILDTWLSTDFEGGRHERRIDMMR